jgi:exopolyphosphatase/pppGpp-phosphohydrolase
MRLIQQPASAQVYAGEVDLTREVRMDDLRDSAGMATSFRAAVELLDHAIDCAHPALSRQGIEIIDHSNRSGFDHSGYPNYFWRHTFRHKSHVHGVLLQAEAAWVEPKTLTELPGRVTLHANVMVFHHGQSPPLFASTPLSQDVPLDACAGGGLLELVQAGLRHAEAELPDQYRAWLSPS